MDLKKIYAWLIEPISNTPIIVFRILFALSLLIQTYCFISQGFIEENIVKPFALFPFINNIQAVSKIYIFNFLINPLLILGYVMLASNIGMLFNKVSRISTFIFFICFTYFWLLDKGYFNNHYYFISIISFLLFLIDQKSSFKQSIHVPRITLVCLQAVIFMIYFIAGLNKLTPFWLVDMQPITHILETKYDTTGNTFFINPALIFFMTYGGVIYDLLIGFLLFCKRTKLLSFILVILFNTFNHYLFQDIGEIGAFPLIMIATLALFIDPNRLDRILKKDEKPRIILAQKLSLNIFIISFIIIQFILPFRHLLFHGYVDYNGMGQRFSWRMKTMYKEAYTDGQIEFDVYIKRLKKGNRKIAHFTLFNIEQFSKAYELPLMYLTKKQKTALFYYPDMLPAFTKEVEKVLKKNLSKKINGDFDIIITARCKIGFMGRTPQDIIDSSIDLTAISSSNTNRWLHELKTHDGDLSN